MRYIVSIVLDNGNRVEVGVEAENKLQALKRWFSEVLPNVEDKVTEVAQGAHVTDVTIEEDKGQSKAVNTARLINTNPN